jgi:hypothetical protein
MSKMLTKVTLCTMDQPIKECVKRSEVMALDRKFGFVYCPVNKGYMFVHAIVQTNPTRSGLLHITEVGVVKTRTQMTKADMSISDHWDKYHHMDVYFPKEYWSASTEYLHDLVAQTCNSQPCSCQHDCCGCMIITVWHKADRVSRRCIRVSVNLSRNV